MTETDEPQVGLELEHSIGFSTNNQGIAFHPDPTKSLIVFSCGKLLCISDLDDAHEQRLLSGHDAAISALDVSPSGSLIASGQCSSIDGHVYFNLWDFHTSEVRMRIRTPHRERVEAIRFSPDEAMIATTGKEGGLMVWDATTGKGVGTFKDTISSDEAKSVAWGPMLNVGSRDQQYMLYVAFNTGVRICNLSFCIRKLAFELTATACQVPGAGGRQGGFVRKYQALLQIENDLLCGTSSGDLVVYNANGGFYRTSLTIAANGVTSLVYNELYNCVFVGGGDGKLRKISGSEKNWKLEGEVQFEGSIATMAGSFDDHQIVLLTSAGLMYRVLTADMTYTVAAEAPLGGLRDTTLSLDRPDLFATVSNDGYLRVWDLNTYAVVSQFTLSQSARSGHATDVPIPTACSFDCEPNHLVVGWSDGRIRAINAQGPQGELAWALSNGHKGAVHTVHVCPLYIVSGGEDSSIRIWSRGTKDLIAQMQNHKLPTTGVHIDNTAPTLIHTYSLDCSLFAYDLSKLDMNPNVKAPKQVAMHSHAQSGGILCATQRPDYEHEMVVGTVDGTVLVYDLDYPQPVAMVVDANRARVTSCQVAPNGKHLAVGLSDGSVVVYKFEQDSQGRPNLHLVLQALCHSGAVVRCCWTGDGKQILSAGSDGELIIWNFYSRL